MNKETIEQALSQGKRIDVQSVIKNTVVFFRIDSGCCGEQHSVEHVMENISAHCGNDFSLCSVED